MSNPRNAGLWVLAAALIALFVWGAAQVAFVPLEAGDVYPPYSTLRSDPLGAKALYESLALQPELQMSRLYKARTPLSARQALFVLGLDSHSWFVLPQSALTGYEGLLARGGRLVIGFLPAHASHAKPKLNNSPVLSDRWKIRFAYREEEEDDDVDRSALPRESALYFEPGKEWRVLAERDGLAIAAERTIGGGTVVLVAESYRVSNEGLRESRDSSLISGFIGDSRSVAFDENHFGITETGSVMGLMRKYRLEGALAMLLVAAGLFIWRSGSAFLPPRVRPADAAFAGRHSQEGLAALLRRSVPEKDLLNVCYAEWARSAPRERRAQAVKSEIARQPGRNPVETYQAARRLLTEIK